MKKLLGLVLVLILFTVPVAQADNVWSMAESEQYGRKAGGMLLRGLLNVVSSPVDLVVGTVQGSKDGPPFVGFMRGLGKGTGCFAVRLLSGALDVVTFWVPHFNGYPPCRSYADCMNCDSGTMKRGYVPPPVPLQTYTPPPPPAYAPPPTPVQPPPAQQEDDSPMRYIKK